MKSSVLSILSLIVLARAQDIDPDLIDLPPEGIDFEGCFSDLVTADVNGDGFVKQNEYLNFINTYGKRICHYQEKLTLQQEIAFSSLACNCRSQENASPDCCLRENARIPTTGVSSPSQRTEEQSQYLTSVCVVTDDTIDGECPPVIRDRSTPPPILIAPVLADIVNDDGGLSNAAKWGIIVAAIAAALLLLLLCCCCCVVRRRRGKAVEEEEEETGVLATKSLNGQEMAPDDAAPHGNRDGPDLENGVPFAAASTPRSREDSEYTEEEDASDDESGDGRGKRGCNYMEEEDEAGRRRLRGAGEIPEGGGGNSHALRPIPPKIPEEDPDWDHPGRNIDYPKPDPDEDSVQEFDPYNPGGGVDWPEREKKPPVTFKNNWERLKKDDPDEIDNRKHRIQTGLGEGEVWDKLNEGDEPEKTNSGASGDVFDWVVQSALGVLDNSEAQGHVGHDA
ncbi:predicted protein [Phaeodactylum tricornutum CCAP 1055/1]|jgi:hypothetical protein|uniref:Calmodulin n=1 Tax=Phaeodactylum tricornutum (strain CCAP 1055/1) TaxID=556484 RepID=B7GCN1_PHATC|nr:predicted protein [Phaeodactylum tricornutum CCAP 1055/1]EEC43641.1 predicted protein [Phaeodactylum tricornutum CCAP 1055/1]|eukprot:XP_002184905.1 predicted protein [Phaeodactylum tricornutum CCAP 1055/1]